MDDHIALFVTIHPASPAKQTTILSYLRNGARGYYRRPSSNCIAWSYLAPQLSESSSPVLTGLEIYTKKSALQDQIKDAGFFQPYHEAVAKKKLYVREEEMVAWYLAAGFLTRGKKGVEEGGGTVMVRVRQVTCRQHEREGVGKGLEAFADFARKTEPGILTFAIFTRKKAEDEILVYVRYRERERMHKFEESPEHQNFW